MLSLRETVILPRLLPGCGNTRFINKMLMDLLLYGIDVNIISGCSKRLFSKAAADGSTGGVAPGLR
jgi:hypothetical protein